MIQLITQNWRIFAAIGIILISSLSLNAWQYSRNSSLIKENAVIEIANGICQKDYEGLEEELETLKKDIAKIKEENEAMTNKILESKKTIKQINNDRELLLQEMRTKIVPESCEDKFQWLREQAIEFSNKN